MDLNIAEYFYNFRLSNSESNLVLKFKIALSSLIIINYAINFN
jgi:hypothetical protein